MTGCILTGYPTVKGEEIEVAESAVSSIDLSTRGSCCRTRTRSSTDIQYLATFYGFQRGSNYR